MTFTNKRLKVFLATGHHYTGLCVQDGDFLVLLDDRTGQHTHLAKKTIATILELSSEVSNEE